MASKAQEVSPEDVEGLLDVVDKTLDRLKTLYEQYFLGIQKQPPTFIHNDVERKLRDLTQLQIRNTGLRYRFLTLQQKFGSYNSYWRRTMRQIENGKYARNLSKIGRDAVRTGAAIPEEILAAMPKRMRDQVVRDREQALAIAKRRKLDEAGENLVAAEGDFSLDVDFEGEQLPPEADDVIAMIKEPTELRQSLKTRSGAHILDEADGEIDIDAFFAEVQSEPDPIPTPIRQTPSAPVRAASITTPPMSRAPAASPRPPIAGQRAAGQSPAGQAAPGQASGAASGPVPGQRTGGQPIVPAPVPRTGGQPIVPAPGQRTGGQPIVPAPGQRTGGLPIVPAPGQRSGGLPIVPAPAPIPRLPAKPGVVGPASSQATRPNPVAPGAASAHGNVQVESMAGPFARSPIESLDDAPTPPAGYRPATSPSGPAANRQTPPGGVPAVGRPAGPPASGSNMPRSQAPPASGAVPSSRLTPPGGVPAVNANVRPTGQAPGSRQTLPGGVPAMSATPTAASSARPTGPGSAQGSRQTLPGGVPAVASARTGPSPVVPRSAETPSTGVPKVQHDEEGSASRPIVTATRPTVRAASPKPVPAQPKPAPTAPQRPPPGMTDADVNALYAKYVKAKEMVGEKIGPGEHSKLLKTINAQAPKIMEQYKAKAVDFSVVVKDNQVIIRAKPKT